MPRMVAMKQLFTRQLDLQLCITAKMAIVWPDDPPMRRVRKDGRRIPLRRMKSTKAAGPTASETFKVGVETMPMLSTGVPSSSFEISCFAKSSLSREIPYLNKHLKPAVGDLISCLLEECKLQSLRYEIPEHEFSEDRIESEIDDKYLVNREKHIKKLADRFESSIRRRINPERLKKGKTEFRRALDRKSALNLFRVALNRLRTDGEKITKAAVARKLRIGSRENPTASLRHWLNEHKIDWAEEYRLALKEE